MSKATGKARYPHDSRRPPSAAVKLGVEIYREEGDIEYLRNSLSPRQRAFCEEYIIDFNGHASYIRAGYSPNSADRAASNLLKNPGIVAYIDYLSGSKESKIVSVNPDYVLSEVTRIISKEGAKDSDKLRGLELLARHLGMLRDKTEISGPDGGAIEVENRRIEEEAQSFTHLIKGMTKKKDVKIV